MKTEYRCPYCNSANVLQDAYVAMNDPDDVRVFDNKVCDDCGKDFNEAVEVQVEDEEN